MSFDVVAEVMIRAPRAVVWEVLTDVARWKEWSTWLAWDGGDVQVGQRLRLRLRLTPPGGGGYAFTPEVLRIDAPSHFAWVGRTGLPGVFDGEHHFVLEEVEGGTRLLNHERYSGLLSPLIQRIPAMKDAPAGFAAMNDEVRLRAERLAGAA